MPRTSFLPNTHGFLFVNTFRVSANRIGPLPDIHFSGLCGGMSYAALDYFKARLPIPSLPYKPLVGSTLESYIFDRQQDSTIKSFDNIARWAELSLNPGGIRNAEFFSWGLTSRLAELRGRIDAGEPVPLGLKGASGQGDHQVLAIGYELGRYRGDGGAHVEDLEILVWDPNHLRTETRMKADPATKTFRYADSTKRWQGYFVDSAYRPRRPPVAELVPDYPKDGMVYEVHVEICTGGDDLRGGNDNLSIELRYRSGASRVYENVNRSQRWIDREDQRVRIPLERGVPRAELRTMILRTSFGGLTPDNWNVDGLRVFFLVDGQYNRVHERYGQPLVRFNAHNVPYAVSLGHEQSDGVVDELLITCRTGGDDLRGGNDNVHATVTFVGGRRPPQIFPNINERRRWADRSTASAILRLDRPARVDELESLTLTTTFGGGFSGDNWNLDALEVSAEGIELHQSAGRPLIRFDGNNRPFVAKLRGTGAGVCTGDLVVLEHANSGALLHSHPHNYSHPGGSRQQQVTGFYHRDSNDGWRVRPSHREGNGGPERAIANGALFRMTHVPTGRNLHSHAGLRSPVSGQQEVTAFGEAGRGDDNCDWRIETSSGGPLRYGERVRIIHAKTNAALHSHTLVSPLLFGQQEVTAYAGRDSNDFWIFWVSPYRNVVAGSTGVREAEPA